MNGRSRRNGHKIGSVLDECKGMCFIVIMNSMHAINLTREDYEMVLTVADEASVTRAATQLHLSQSAVSHHLRALEARLGTPLFLREPRRMVLSPVGEEFVSSPRHIISQLHRSDTKPNAHATPRRHHHTNRTHDNPTT